MVETYIYDSTIPVDVNTFFVIFCIEGYMSKVYVQEYSIYAFVTKIVSLVESGHKLDIANYPRLNGPSMFTATFDAPKAFKGEGSQDVGKSNDSLAEQSAEDANILSAEEFVPVAEKIRQEHELVVEKYSGSVGGEAPEVVESPPVVSEDIITKGDDLAPETVKPVRRGGRPKKS